MDGHEHLRDAPLFMLIDLVLLAALWVNAYAYVPAEWTPLLPLVPASPRFAGALSGPERAPAILERPRPWLVLAFVLSAIAYGPMLRRLGPRRPSTPAACGPGEDAPSGRGGGR